MSVKETQNIVKSSRGNKFNQTAAWLDRHDFVPNGAYMGNIHTGVFHEFGCKDIDAMNEEHKVETNNDKGLYRPCGHCKLGFGKYLKLDTFKTSRDEPEDIELCEDPKVHKIFDGVKCSCGSTDGTIKMRPHQGGVRLLGHKEKMWIFRECYSCKHQLSLDKAMNKNESAGVWRI